MHVLTIKLTHWAWAACGETESEKRIRNTLNKTCRAELVTGRNRDYRLYSIPEHSFFIYYWEFSDGFVQGKPNIDKYFWIRSSVEVIRSLHESLWKAQGRESLFFQTYVTFSISFPNIYIDYLHSNVIDSFFYLFWWTKAISPTCHLRVSHPFRSCFFGYCF